MLYVLRSMRITNPATPGLRLLSRAPPMMIQNRTRSISFICLVIPLKAPLRIGNAIVPSSMPTARAARDGLEIVSKKAPQSSSTIGIAVTISFAQSAAAILARVVANTLDRWWGCGGWASRRSLGRHPGFLRPVPTAHAVVPRCKCVSY
jgi:hypothetical protein